MNTIARLGAINLYTWVPRVPQIPPRGRQLPSLKEYEEANRKARESRKILVLEHEAEVPKVA